MKKPNIKKKKDSALQRRGLRFDPWSGNQDPTCCGAAKPGCCKALEPQLESPCSPRKIPQDTVKIPRAAAKT